MKLTAREIELLNKWRRTCVYDSQRSVHMALTKFKIKRNALNNERINLIDKILKEVDDGETSKE